jgi:hypothetical protein
MPATTIETLRQQIELSELLQAGRDAMIEPQDLPGRFGRVIADIDRVLAAMDCPCVLAGGWAVWRHGYAARVTRDIDIVLPRDRVDEFLRVAGVSGFDVLTATAGRWPKVEHRQTQITVDILPEGERPGTAARPAPTMIPSPTELGGLAGALRYIDLARLIELKFAAGRPRDLADVVELIRSNPKRCDAIRRHLADVHADYAASFDQLREQADDADDR